MVTTAFLLSADLLDVFNGTLQKFNEFFHFLGTINL